MMIPADDRCASAPIGERELELDPVNCVIRYRGKGLPLAIIEYRALALLIRRAGDLVTYQTIAEAGGGWIEYDEKKLPKLLSTVISRIGRRLAAAGAQNLIQ